MGMCQSREAEEAINNNNNNNNIDDNKASAEHLLLLRTSSSTSSHHDHQHHHQHHHRNKFFPAAVRRLKRTPSESSFCSQIIPEVTEDDTDFDGIGGDHHGEQKGFYADGGGAGDYYYDNTDNASYTSNNSRTTRYGKTLIKKSTSNGNLVVAWSPSVVTEATSIISPVSDTTTSTITPPTPYHNNNNNTNTNTTPFVVQDVTTTTTQQQQQQQQQQFHHHDDGEDVGVMMDNEDNDNLPPMKMTIIAPRSSSSQLDDAGPSDEEDNNDPYYDDDDEQPGRLVIGKLQCARIRSPSSAALVAPPRPSFVTDIPVAPAYNTATTTTTSQQQQQPSGLDGTSSNNNASRPPVLLDPEPTASVHPQTVSHFKRLELQNKLQQQQQESQAKIRKYQDRYQDVQQYKQLWNEFQQLQQKQEQEKQQQHEQQHEQEVKKQHGQEQQPTSSSKAMAPDTSIPTATTTTTTTSSKKVPIDPPAGSFSTRGINTKQQKSALLSPKPLLPKMKMTSTSTTTTTINNNNENNSNVTTTTANNNVAGTATTEQQPNNNTDKTTKKKKKRVFRPAKFFQSYSSIVNSQSAGKKKNKKTNKKQRDTSTPTTTSTTPQPSSATSRSTTDGGQQPRSKPASAATTTIAASASSPAVADAPVLTTTAAESNRRKSTKNMTTTSSRSSRKNRQRSNSFDIKESGNWYFDFQAVDFAYEGEGAAEANQCNLSLHSGSSLEYQRRFFAEKRRQRKQKKRSSNKPPRTQHGPPLTCTPPLSQFLARQSQIQTDGCDDVSEDLTNNRSYGGYGYGGEDGGSLCSGSQVSYDYGPARRRSTRHSRAAASVNSAPPTSSHISPAHMEVSFTTSSNEGDDNHHNTNNHHHDNDSCYSDLGEDASLTGSRYSYASYGSKNNDYRVTRRRRSNDHASREKLTSLEDRVRALQQSQQKDEEKKEGQQTTPIAANTTPSLPQEEVPSHPSDITSAVDDSSTSMVNSNNNNTTGSLAAPSLAEPSPLNASSLIEKFNGMTTRATSARTSTTTLSSSLRPPKPPTATAARAIANTNKVIPSLMRSKATTEYDILLDPSELAGEKSEAGEDEDDFARIVRGEALTSSSSASLPACPTAGEIIDPPQLNTPLDNNDKENERMDTGAALVLPSNPPRSLLDSSAVPPVAPSPLPNSQLVTKFNGAAVARSVAGDRTACGLREEYYESARVGSASETAVKQLAVEEDIPAIPKVPTKENRRSDWTNSNTRVPSNPSCSFAVGSAVSSDLEDKPASSYASPPRKTSSMSPSTNKPKSPKKIAWISKLSPQQFLLLSEENALERAARIEHNEAKKPESNIDLSDSSLDDDREDEAFASANVLYPSNVIPPLRLPPASSRDGGGECNDSETASACNSSMDNSYLDLADSLRLADSVEARVKEVLHNYRD